MLTVASVIYSGSSGATFTNNSVYDVVAWAGSNPVVIGDNGTVQPISIGGDWAFVSIKTLKIVDVYP